MCLYVEKLSSPALDSMGLGFFLGLLQLPCSLNKANVKFYPLTRTGYERGRVLQKDVSRNDNFFVKIKAIIYIRC